MTPLAHSWPQHQSQCAQPCSTAGADKALGSGYASKEEAYRPDILLLFHLCHSWQVSAVTENVYTFGLALLHQRLGVILHALPCASPGAPDPALSRPSK